MLWRAEPSYARPRAKSTAMERIGRGHGRSHGKPPCSGWMEGRGRTIPAPFVVQCGAMVAQPGLPGRRRAPIFTAPTLPSREPTMRPAPTLLVLAAAAAFGGFAATVIRDAVQSPARAAEPATAQAVPMVAALPMAVEGQPMPSLAPMLQRVTPSVVSVQAAQRRQVRPFGNDPFFRRMVPDLS